VSTLLQQESGQVTDHGVSLVDLLDRLLDTGVTLSGDLVLSVAGVDLVWVGLRAIVSSVETARPQGTRSTSGSATRPASAVGAPAAADLLVPATVGTRPAAPEPGREAAAPAQRLDVREDDVGRGLVQLVLTVVDLLRQLMERQAITRMEGGGLDDAEIERLGSALMQLSDRMNDLKEMFGLSDEDLALDLGPIGDLL
jgi:hypothetical protein